MTQTLLGVLPLAIGSTLSPVLVLLQAATLASRFHPVARAYLVLIGNTIVVAIVTAVVVIIGHGRVDAAGEAGGAGGIGEIGAWIRIVLAVLLALTAVRLLAGGRNANGSLRTPTTPTNPGVLPGRFLLAGIGGMTGNITSMVLFIPALETTATAGLQPVGETAIIAVLWAFILLPVYLPVVLYVAFRQRGPAALEGFGRWLRTNNRTIGILIAGGFAIYLGWTGLAALT